MGPRSTKHRCCHRNYHQEPRQYTGTDVLTEESVKHRKRNLSSPHHSRSAGGGGYKNDMKKWAFSFPARRPKTPARCSQDERWNTSLTILMSTITALAFYAFAECAWVPRRSPATPLWMKLSRLQEGNGFGKRAYNILTCPISTVVLLNFHIPAEHGPYNVLLPEMESRGRV